MRSTVYNPAPSPNHTGAQSSTSGFLASLVGKWRDYRLQQETDSLPYAVMKDIGFRAAETKNAK